MSVELRTRRCFHHGRCIWHVIGSAKRRRPRALQILFRVIASDIRVSVGVAVSLLVLVFVFIVVVVVFVGLLFVFVVVAVLFAMVRGIGELCIGCSFFVVFNVRNGRQRKLGWTECIRIDVSNSSGVLWNRLWQSQIVIVLRWLFGQQRLDFVFVQFLQQLLQFGCDLTALLLCIRSGQQSDHFVDFLPGLLEELIVSLQLFRLVVFPQMCT
mmetsp:Transcript_47396/g.76007  ORF Transcript_47396/g.76007 Transcript_47396/m.76007 type:complete len:212 (-) Transcript_47396:730-1365(-)